ncbi:hypothetical protein K402DRAFT_318424, partial [Aulographum hederae CBS 113979]
LVVFSLLLPISSAAKCYSIQGQPMKEYYVPCNSTAQYSPCCNNGDLCSTNGLCLAMSGAWQGFIYGEGCTDSTGRANVCPQVCQNIPATWNTYNVLQCSPGTWCCRDAKDNASCCDTPSRIITSSPLGRVLMLRAGELDDDAISASPSSSTTPQSSLPSILPPAGPTSSTPSESPSPPSQQCAKCNSATIGGAVGGALGAAFLAALGALLVLRKRKKNLER